MILVFLLSLSKNLDDSIMYKKMLIYVSLVFNEDFGKINFKNADLLKELIDIKKAILFN